MHFTCTLYFSIIRKGLDYILIENSININQKVREVLNSKSAVICEILVDQDQMTLPKVSNKKDEDGQFHSLPMEDLYPFLERKEYNEIMNKYK